MSLHLEPPVHEIGDLVSLESIAERRDFVRERFRRDHGARKLPRQRIAAKEPMCGVGERLARTVQAVSIRRDESESAPCRVERGTERTARGDHSASDQCAPREPGHRTDSVGPAIIARTREPNPASMIITT